MISNRIKTKAIDLFDFCSEVISHFKKDRGLIIASSMVYSTLIAMVPFLAFIIIILSKLNIINTTQIQVLIDENIIKSILPANQQVITDYINHFTENASKLGWFGFITFLLTSLFLINKINYTFNLIYKTSPKKNTIIRFTLYLTGMIIGSLFIGMIFSLTAPLHTILEKSNIITTTHFSYNFFTKLGPWFLIFFALLLIIKTTPSTKVKWKSSLIGALFGTIVWQLTNIIFSLVIDKMFTYEKIYGSLASALFFLIWIYLIWIIIYLSLEISFVHQYKSYKNRG